MRIDRLLLALYFVAVMGLLMIPFEGPNFRVLGVASDKWVHFALFGGLAVLLRWNLSTIQHSILISIGLAFIVAAATEVAQGLVAYRSAEFFDLLASLFGALIGAVIANQIYSYPAAQKLIGQVVSVLGLSIVVFFLFADQIGMGEGARFGVLQVVGTGLGLLIAVVGVRLRVIGLNDQRSD